MSTKRSDEAIQSEDEPVKKRQKTSSRACLLLESSPEVLRNVYSFLILKDALEITRTCRQLRNDTNNVFRYSCIMDYEGLRKQGTSTTDAYHYLNSQENILCNPVSLDNLRSVLLNESLPDYIEHSFIYYMINRSKTDNGEAISILLEDQRCKVTCELLEEALKKHFTNMGAVLQNDERIKKDIRTCGTCNDGIGIYKCTNLEDRCLQWGPQYCRSCVLKANRFCKECGDYLCPSCFADENYRSCEKCQGMLCEYDECIFRMKRCDRCGRGKCTSCIEADNESWEYRYGTLCPTCHPMKT